MQTTKNYCDFCGKEMPSYALTQYKLSDDTVPQIEGNFANIDLCDECKRKWLMLVDRNPDHLYIRNKEFINQKKPFVEGKLSEDDVNG